MIVTADLAKTTVMWTTDQTRNIKSEKLEGKNFTKDTFTKIKMQKLFMSFSASSTIR